MPYLIAAVYLPPMKTTPLTWRLPKHLTLQLENLLLTVDLTCVMVAMYLRKFVEPIRSGCSRHAFCAMEERQSYPRITPAPSLTKENILYFLRSIHLAHKFKVFIKNACCCAD